MCVCRGVQLQHGTEMRSDVRGLMLFAPPAPHPPVQREIKGLPVAVARARLRPLPQD